MSPEIVPKETNATLANKQALAFLAHGPHEMSRTVDNMEEVAAVLIFADLVKQGLAVASHGDDKITYRLTAKGSEQARSLPSLPELLDTPMPTPCA